MRDFCHDSKCMGQVTKLHSTTQHRWYETHRSQMKRVTAWLLACALGTASCGLFASEDVAPATETTAASQSASERSNTDAVNEINGEQAAVSSGKPNDTVESHDGLAWWDGESDHSATATAIAETAPATEVIEPAAVNILSESTPVVLHAPAQAARNDVQLTSFEANDTSGLMWWATHQSNRKLCRAAAHAKRLDVHSKPA